MTNQKYIVICGDPVNGFKYYGPFDTVEEAQHWAEGDSHETWVAPLEFPLYEQWPN